MRINLEIFKSISVVEWVRNSQPFDATIVGDDEGVYILAPIFILRLFLYLF